jgi:hypothetical protein
MKKFFTILAAIILIVAIALWQISEPRPVGQRGPQAEALADKMLAAIDVEAWESIALVSWTFVGSHNYIWHKHHHVAQVKWDTYEVVMNLNTLNGEASRDGVILTGDDKSKAIEKAYAHWCNDSFWLNAPAKMRDEGTERSVVKLDDGTEALLVEYSSGGVTPGDAYLWVLDEKGVPEYYQMWVSIIPIGGVKATWESWSDLDGAAISTSHKIWPFSIGVTNLMSGTSEADFDLAADYFSRWSGK